VRAAPFLTIPVYYALKIVTPTRRFVKQGKLVKITSRFVKEVLYFLFNDVLIYGYEVPYAPCHDKAVVTLNRLSCVSPDDGLVHLQGRDRDGYDVDSRPAQHGPYVRPRPLSCSLVECRRRCRRSLS
jgi:hypothetical protein